MPTRTTRVGAARPVDDGGPAAGRVARRRPSLAIPIAVLATLLVATLISGCGGPGTSAGAGATSTDLSSTPATSPGASPPGTSTAGSPTPPASTAPTASASGSATASGTAGASSGFALTTTAFPVGGEIPARFTCDGEDLSPDLAWSRAPQGTVALVVVVDDPDAGGFVHWIMYDLPGADSGMLPLGFSTSPHPPPQGRNDFGSVGWRGPCPPSGEHRYRFTLSALDAPLRLPGTPNGKDIREALAAATVLGTATLEGRYRRP